MYLTQRSYLLAGFSAASIVAATISWAPRPAVNLPSIQAAEMRLSAAQSEAAAAARALRTLGERAQSAVSVRTTTVVPGVAQRAAIGSQATPGGTTSPSNALRTSRSGAFTGAAPTAPDVITPADLLPLIGDVAALNLDLLDTPFFLTNGLIRAGIILIDDVNNGRLQDIPNDVLNSLALNASSAISRIDGVVRILTDEVDHLRGITPHTASSTPQTPGDSAKAGTTTAPATPLAPTRSATADFDPGAVGTLVGDTAILGLDVVATPIVFASEVTIGLANAALDLGAGQVQDAENAIETGLRGAFITTEGNIGADLGNIEAALAQLTGTAEERKSESVPPTAAKRAAATLPRITSVSPSPSHTTNVHSRTDASPQPTGAKQIGKPSSEAHEHGNTPAHAAPPVHAANGGKHRK